MTKQKLKEAYVNWNKEITKLGNRKTEIFNKLQEMCKEKGDGHCWACMEKLVEELAKKGYIYQAMQLVNEYYKISGQEEALRNFAIVTNNFEI